MQKKFPTNNKNSRTSSKFKFKYDKYEPIDY